jgi:hypothetical protein
MSTVLTARARKLYRDASARHEAGDRVAALKLFRKVAFGPSAPEVVPEIDGAWAMLMADAAEHDGPNAVRTLWRVARAHRKLFPWPGVAVQLVELLMGRDVPDILAEAVAACRAYARNWSLDSDERLVLKLAEEEIDATMDRTSGAAPVPAPHLDVRDRPLPAA